MPAGRWLPQLERREQLCVRLARAHSVRNGRLFGGVAHGHQQVHLLVLWPAGAMRSSEDVRQDSLSQRALGSRPAATYENKGKGTAAARACAAPTCRLLREFACLRSWVLR
jgi:hypothetical protein